MLLITYPFYLLRLALYFTYGFLVFLSKPGARVLFPLIVGALVYWQRDWLTAQTALAPYFELLAWHFPLDAVLGPVPLDYYLYLAVFILTMCVWIGSSLLRPVLGSLPPMRRPLPPLRKLKARHRPTYPVHAQVIVPKLGRTWWGGQEHHLTRRLPPRLQKLLEAPQSVRRPLKDVTPQGIPQRPSQLPSQAQKPSPVPQPPQAPLRSPPGPPQPPLPPRSS